ncbi:hypothetical protein B6N13_02095 [Marinomonas sp. UCMA 3892]|uniref:glycosyltransferase n=1 Tax=Marinomonas sp. UCMA 3892 TaxID=1972585 RepID=UPI00146BE7A8|nr:glycosyltransferase [Marinomonas sp. UCMA 3892]NLU96889.1 hypothetical protein [Marinomonas sp. UCMA 3892]
MKTVVIFQEKVMHYRIDFFNVLSEKFNVIVVTNEVNQYLELCRFATVVLKCKKYGVFSIVPKLNRFIKEISPDIVISTFDIRLLSVVYMMFRNKNKAIWWGLDTGKNMLATKVKVLIAKMKIPIIFYSKHNMEKFIKKGVKKNKCFYANNTFHVHQRTKSFLYKKNSFIFVGSFDKRKKIEVLIKVFYDVLPKLDPSTKLYLIGDGDTFSETQLLVNELNLSDRVKMLGRITNSSELIEYYNSSYASISLGQAGLSVLQSFAFGVPFITYKNAISGSEITNIINEYNGYLINNMNELGDLIVAMESNSIDAAKLGENAYRYYDDYCSIEKMSEVFSRLVEEVSND